MIKSTLFFLLSVQIGYAQIPSKDSLAVPAAALDSQRSKFVSYIPPIIFIGYGFTALSNGPAKRLDQSVFRDMREDHPGFSTQVDNYLQFAPAVAVYALNFSGIKGKNTFAERTILYAMSNALMGGSVLILKHTTKQIRPNGDDNNSFPSGHSATAFAAAEFMYQEYGDVSPWYGIAGYAAATATGILRVYNNDHWFSNIVAGAGLGILSTKVSYLIYPYLKRKFYHGKSAHAIVMPTWQNGFAGMAYVKQF